MQSRVSVRGQTVIPREIREQLGITPSDTLEWQVRDGIILVYPMPADPVRASVGVLKGKGTFQDFIDERDAERASERAKERES